MRTPFVAPLLMAILLMSSYVSGQSDHPSLSDVFDTYHVQKVKNKKLKSADEQRDIVISLSKDEKIVVRLIESDLISRHIG